VPPTAEVAARQIVDETSRGVSSQADLAKKEEALLEDEPVRSYFLAWLIPLVYYFIWIFIFAALPDGRSDTHFTNLTGALLVFASLLNWLGMFWMMGQAMRYEVRPFRYCVASLIPLACVWYYVKRYQARKGSQRLPIAVRMRKQQPPAS
jgi:positive regulator of sigma E activity